MQNIVHLMEMVFLNPRAKLTLNFTYFFLQ